MTTHTPAYWKVRELENNEIWITDDCGGFVAEVWGSDRALRHVNAALIADAPRLKEENARLREALKQCYAYANNDYLAKETIQENVKFHAKKILTGGNEL